MVERHGLAQRPSRIKHHHLSLAEKQAGREKELFERGRGRWRRSGWFEYQIDLQNPWNLRRQLSMS